MNIGPTLQKIRQERGLNLRELAQKAQTTYAHISKIENGKNDPGIDLLTRICQALDVPVSHVVMIVEHDLMKQRTYRQLKPVLRRAETQLKKLTA